MPIELSREHKIDAIRSIERYFQDERDERIGNLAAGALLNYFLEEIGPLIYNQAVAEAQERLLMRVQELDIELHEEPLQYWPRRSRSVR